MRILGFDVETTKTPTLHPWQTNALLVAVGLCDENGWKQTWVFNHDQLTGDGPTQREMINEIQLHFDCADIVVGHNIKFDLNWANSIGIDYSSCKLWCTMVTEYLLEGQRPDDLSLAQLSKKYGIADKIDKVKRYWDAGYETTEIPLSTLLPYLEQDCINTLAIMRKQQPLVAKANLEAVCKVQNEVTRSLSAIECNGMKFNKEIAEGYINKLTTELKEIDDELVHLFGYSINLSSGDQLSAALYGGVFAIPTLVWTTRKLKHETKYYQIQGRKDIKLDGLGFTPKKGTELKKGGYYSTDKSVIKALVCKTKDQKVAKNLLLNRSTVKKALETFVGSKPGTGLINKIQQDGCIHSKYNQCVTKTGRLSSSDPNGQNLPRKGTSPIKEAIEPRYDYIMGADLSQIEWRIAAFLSQDPVMNQEIWDGVDVHSDNAIKIFGAKPDDKDFSDTRTVAKIVTFRLIYGGSHYGFYLDSKMPNYSSQKWKDIVDAFWEKYVVLRRWQTGNANLVARQKGVLYSVTGRIYKFNWSDKGFSQQQICNFPVQGMATADTMPLAMCIIFKQWQKRRLKSLFIGQVHDSIIFDVIKEEMPIIHDLCMYVFNRLPHYIEQVYGLKVNVPLTGDIEYGINYGSLKKYIKGESIVR